MFGRFARLGALATFSFIVGASFVAAQTAVTVLLKSGDRVQGQLASFDQSTVDIRDGSGQRRPVTWNDVVLLDFVGGARNLPSTERDAAAASQSTIVMKGGESLKGRIVDFTNEGGANAAVVFQSSDQGQRSIPLDQVGRIYVSNFTSEAMASAGFPGETSTSTAPAQTGSAVPQGDGTVVVTVPGTSRWQGTGLFVRSGDVVQFSSDGTVYLRSGGQDPAQPAGALSGRSAPGASVAGVLAGALVGRVGDRGAPFGIGNQTSLTMPAAGELFLGVNDDELSDNQGSFTVRVTRQATTRRRH